MFTAPSKLSHRTAPPSVTVQTVNPKTGYRPVYGNLFSWSDSDSDRVVQADVQIKSSSTLN